MKYTNYKQHKISLKSTLKKYSVILINLMDLRRPYNMEYYISGDSAGEKKNVKL